MKQPEDYKAVSGDSGPEPVMENNEQTNEIQDTMDETVLLGLNDSAVNQETISPCNDNQEEIQQTTVTFPTPADESQQYLEQKDSSFTQAVRYRLALSPE